MYTRDILPPRTSPIEDGVPVFGTWDRPFDIVDLLEIRRPYKFPLPRWARDFRIKERQCFYIQDNHILMEANFCNFKLFRIAQILVYDKKSGEKHFFRMIKPGSGWNLPYSLENSSVSSNSRSFYFRIHDWLNINTIKLDLYIEAARRRPSLTVHLAFNTSQETTPVAVSMSVTPSRNIYALKTLSPVRGDIVFGGKHFNLKWENCSGFFCDYKGFYPYRTQTVICAAMGFCEKNRRFGFHIAENQTRDTRKSNENALWVEGKLTLLPPVLVTMPNGPEGDWVIQDIEGMVDLTFTPVDQNKSVLEFIVTYFEFNAPLGYYNGVLVSSEGEKIQIKNLFGVGEKINVRV
ncbi:MAG: DUF2804 domain-containing protein [Treponema sp.]|nr:DUF2804 domain-containing protein [Treponema sp.]